MRRIIFSLTKYTLIFLIFLGCSEQRFEFEKDSTSITTPLVEEVEKDPLTVSNFHDFLKIEVTEMTDVPERYLVNFVWKKPSEPLRIEIVVKKSQESQKETITIDPSLISFSHPVSHNQTINYEFYIFKNNSPFRNVFKKTVEIPKDYVVREDNKNLKEDLLMRVNRFFLSKEITLTTNGHDLAIYANKFFSNDGIIQTFPKNSYSQNGPGSDGKSGGYIQINSPRAFGDITIRMCGENGADGNMTINHGGNGGDAGTLVFEIDEMGETQKIFHSPGIESCYGSGGYGRSDYGKNGDGAKICGGMATKWRCLKKYPLDSLR